MVKTTFMVRCRDEVIAVFRSLALPPPEFVSKGESEQEFLAADFQLRGKDHRLEIATDIPMLYVGDRRYECYLAKEFESEESLVRGFTTRLARYISGGAWEGPDEIGLGERLKNGVKRLVGM